MSKRIKGITIAIDGETTGLEKSLSSITRESMSVGNELKDVQRLLKLNPGNAELIAQQQQLLAKQIEITSNKLDGLKDAQAQVDQQFKKGEISEEQYRAFNRELEATEGALKGYKGQLANIQTEQDRLGKNTSRLDSFFQATGSSIEDFRDVLGSRLTNSIKNGTASADDMEVALNKMGKAALGGKVDIGALKTALDKVDDGSSISDVRTELNKLGAESDETADQLEEMSGKLSADLLSGAADEISGISGKISDLGNLAVEMADQSGSATGKLKAALGLTKEEAESLTGVAKDIYHKGFGESLDEVTSAVQVVKTNIKGLDDVELGNITEQAMVLEQTMGSDMNETLRGTNSLMNTYGITAQEAMDLIVVGSQKGLDKTGELGDNLAEYAPLFQDSGYSAEEMFAILQGGLDGGAYNLDKVNDLVKEFGIRMSDGTVGTAVEDLGSNFQSLFQEIRDGGMSNKDAFQMLASEISNLGTEQEKAAAISAIFGSQGEDAGIKVIDAMQKANTTLTDNKKAYEDAGGAAQKMNDDSTTPLQELNGSLNELKDSLAPIGQTIIESMQPIIDVIGQIALKIGEMPSVVQTFIVAFAGVLAIVSALLPVIIALVVAFTSVEVSLLPIIAIVAGIMIAITALILVIQNWSTIVQWISALFKKFGVDIGAVWNSIKTAITNVVQIVSNFVKQIWGTLVTWWNQNNQLILAAAKTVWNAISAVITTVMNVIKPYLTATWNSIKTIITTVWNVIKIVVNTAINAVLSIIKAVMQVITGDWSGAWDSMKTAVSTILNGIKTTVGNIIEGVASVITNTLSGIGGTVSNIFNGIKDAIEGPMETAKEIVRGAIDAIKGFFNFRFEWPKISLPHFSISGSLNPVDWIKNGGLPKISVDWFAKGGILTKPTVFGQNGGSLMVGGEAGKEAVAPIDTLMGYVRQAVAEANDSNRQPIVVNQYITSPQPLTPREMEREAYFYLRNLAK